MGRATTALRKADGAQLPTEPELGSHFQVSRGTIRQALRELAAEGLIETRGRDGTYARRLPMLEYTVDAEDPYLPPRRLVEWAADTVHAGDPARRPERHHARDGTPRPRA
ncbi:MAG: GntR family transcriptional regulator [Pseudonocardiaceae bacterium]